jgi:cytidine deaminase
MKSDLKQIATQARLRAYAPYSKFSVATPIVPCGACRQVLAEFSPTLTITSWTLSGEKQEFALEDLLPLPKQGILEVPRGT